MVRHIDSIFSQGAFRPVEPVVLAEGTRVHLSVEDGTEISPATRTAKIHTPRLAHPKDAVDFVMKIGETDEAGL